MKTTDEKRGKGEKEHGRATQEISRAPFPLCSFSPLLLFPLALLAGCVHYDHDHFNPAGKRDEHTGFTGFLYVGSAGKIRSEVKDTGTNHSRLITVGTIQGQGDTQFIQAIAAGAAEGALRGAAAATGKP